MKKILFLACGCAAFAATAATITVSNNASLPGSCGQYTTIAAAISAATSGDTILIQGSPTAYNENPTTTKSLTFIGAGYNPQSTSGYHTILNGQITFGNNTSNSAVIGIENVGIVFTNNFAVSNFLISRCLLNSGANAFSGGGSIAVNGVIIEHCIIFGNMIQLSDFPAIVRNCIFMSAGYINGLGSGTAVHTIKNNLWLCYNPFANVRNCLVENNIFFNCLPDNTTLNCTFNNNYVYGVSTLPFGSNIGSGNITNQNNNYATFTACGQITGLSYILSTDWRPLNTSACYNGGTDGKDIGPTGGTNSIYLYPTPYPLTGEPATPQVQTISIPVSSVPAGGTLNINVKARKQN